jgi:prepilin-type N-terminal cleavage/methylation domain-containing protein
MRKQEGFTLIEAAVAIAVVALLSGIIAPLVMKNLSDAQNARAKNDIQVIAAAITSQMKDTGTVPTLAGGPNAATGAGQAIWQSGGTAPVGSGASGAAAPPNSFANLFTGSATNPIQTLALSNAMFGTTAGNEFSFKGPYMTNDVALKTDPWGSAYLIYGYNATSRTSNGPIWVVSAGKDKTILATNVTTANPGGTATTAVYPATWTYTTTSLDDIVLRVN